MSMAILESLIYINLPTQMKRAVIFTMTLQTHNLSEYALTCQFMKYLDLLIKSTLKFEHLRSSSKDYFESFAMKINKYGLISSM